jgi:hypothetical protein
MNTFYVGLFRPSNTRKSHRRLWLQPEAHALVPTAALELMQACILRIWARNTVHPFSRVQVPIV